MIITWTTNFVPQRLLRHKIRCPPSYYRTRYYQKENVRESFGTKRMIFYIGTRISQVREILLVSKVVILL